MRLPFAIRIRLKRLACGGIGGSRDGERVVRWLEIQPGLRVADIGSGFGEFAMRFANAVGPDGIVYAVDTDPDLRAAVAQAAQRRGLTRVRPIAASDDDPGIPEPVDLVFLSSSFHHLPDRLRYFHRLRELVLPGGRVAILEGRPGLISGRFGHSTRPEDVLATLQAAGYRRLDGAEIVSWASLQTFEPTPTSSS